ncbi:MAG: HAD-IA family hydrolase [Verrucomicrobia bacterium]|jgi:phosphoglycolate phosphatase|nr:HAD-IA family hydrolase [Verrucomicrobiota bacterium]
MNQHILFDLDGTLIDHFTTIHKSVAHAQRALGLPESEYATVRATVGGSVPNTLGKLCGSENVAAAEPLFRRHFAEIIFDDVFILPGAEWLLRSLKEKGARLGVFTNKYAEDSRAVLAHLGLDQWLDVIIGTGDSDCPYRKPDPLFTAYALEKLDCASDEAMMVGDSPYDLAAAEAGCLACHLVATGSHSFKELSEHLDPANIHTDLFQLGEKVFGLKRPNGL